jgi:peptide-methionine (S)-S-oxide reductase
MARIVACRKGGIIVAATWTTRSNDERGIETITLAGGCFWCVEAVFEQLRGVVDVQSGYSNGHAPAPTYEAGVHGSTGHAEVVRVRFDPRRLALEDVLKVFFATHDPTTRNRQGADVGTQYRSGIYYGDESQRQVIDRVLAEANHELGGQVVTEVEPLANYSPAEAVSPALFRQ